MKPGPPRRKLVDELGRLQEQIRSVAAKIKRVEEIKKEIREWAADWGAGDDYEIAGSRFVVDLSARQNERSIRSMQTVFDLLGPKKFVSVATITLKALETCTTDEERAELIEEHRTGTRTLATRRKVAL